MYSNLKDEYETKVLIPVAAVPGGGAAANVTLGGIGRGDFQRIYFTVVSGAIGTGSHAIHFTLSDGSGAQLTKNATVNNASPANSIVAQEFLLRDRGAQPKWPALDVVIDAAQGGTASTLGVLAHFPKPNKDIDTEVVLRQCMFALGKGAGMHIHSEVIELVCTHVRENFDAELRRMPGQGEPAAGAPRWQAVSHFILACSEEIGRKAADLARADGSVAIRPDDLKKAYRQVKQNNKPVQVGSYCPDI